MDGHPEQLGMHGDVRNELLLIQARKSPRVSKTTPRSVNWASWSASDQMYVEVLNATHGTELSLDPLGAWVDTSPSVSLASSLIKDVRRRGSSRAMQRE